MNTDNNHRCLANLSQKNRFNTFNIANTSRRTVFVDELEISVDPYRHGEGDIRNKHTMRKRGRIFEIIRHDHHKSDIDTLVVSNLLSSVRLLMYT